MFTIIYKDESGTQKELQTEECEIRYKCPTCGLCSRIDLNPILECPDCTRQEREIGRLYLQHFGSYYDAKSSLLNNKKCSLPNQVHQI